MSGPSTPRPSAPGHAASTLSPHPPPPRTSRPSLSSRRPPVEAKMTVGAAKTTTAATSEVLTWTPTHEARLSYVQQKLKAAQAAWSEEQGLWIDEVIHLEERKRDCLKAEKKMMLTGKRRGNSVAGLLKRPSWGKGGVKGENADVEGKGYAGAICDEGDEDGSGDSEDDDEGKEAANPSSSKTTTRRPSLSTFLRRTMSLGSKNLSGNHSRRNTLDGGQAIRPSLTTSPEGSYSGAEGKGKGKGKDVGNDMGKGNLLKRRGSGR